jgi:hypothetical protein
MHRSTTTTNPKDVDQFTPNTGVAQRKRAGLITLRSYVRIIPPVLLQFTSFTEAGRQC